MARTTAPTAIDPLARALTAVGAALAIAAGIWITATSSSVVSAVPEGSGEVISVAPLLLVMLVSAALAGVLWPKHAVGAGVAMLVIGVVALAVVNLGGFFVGTLACAVAGTLDIVGGRRARATPPPAA